jgi:hypothetical protein
LDTIPYTSLLLQNLQTMKKTLYPLLTAFCLLFFSCDTSDTENTPTPTPVATTDDTPPNLSISNPVSLDNVVDEKESAAVVISGSSDAEDNQVVSILISDDVNNVTGSATVTTGQWTTNELDISAMRDGPIVIVANVSDKAGNNAEPATVEITLDQYDLELAINQPIALDNLIVFAESSVLKVSGSTNARDGQTVTVSFSDGENAVTVSTQVTAGTWEISKTDISSLADGNITIDALLSDSNGDEIQVTVSDIQFDKSILPPAPSQSGTIFLSSTIMSQEDETTLVSITVNGIATREMFDRRTATFNQVEARLFNATYSDGFTIEIQVNPEFTATEALAEAEKYGTEVGRLPKVLKRDVKTIWIHKGNEALGGGNNNLLIHTGKSEIIYEPNNVLLETLIHESAHTSLDSYIKDDPDWLYAQEADGTFISEYARNNSSREDIAETFLLYLAYRYRPESLTEQLKIFIKEAVSYRMDYFDKQNFELAPFN